MPASCKRRHRQWGAPAAWAVLSGWQLRCGGSCQPTPQSWHAQLAGTIGPPWPAGHTPGMLTVVLPSPRTHAWAPVHPRHPPAQPPTPDPLAHCRVGGMHLLAHQVSHAGIHQLKRISRWAAALGGRVLGQQLWVGGRVGGGQVGSKQQGGRTPQGAPAVFAAPARDCRVVSAGAMPAPTHTGLLQGQRGRQAGSVARKPAAQHDGESDGHAAPCSPCWGPYLPHRT